MGDVNTDQKNGDKGKGILKRSNKLSPRVDMTSVVDLAFLLLTFFMLTTTFIKPQIMELKLPEKKDNQLESNQPKVNEKKVLSIILGGENKIYWYTGMTDPKVRETDYSMTGIRKILQEQNKMIDKMFVLIKPDNRSTYENLVDILDELEITDIERYALVDMGVEDHAIMNKYLAKGEVQSTGGSQGRASILATR
jgi:biopolymer transport protein ExbD